MATIANNYDRDDEEEADFVLTRAEAEEETRGRIEIALPDKYRRSQLALVCLSPSVVCVEELLCSGVEFYLGRRDSLGQNSSTLQLLHSSVESSSSTLRGGSRGVVFFDSQNKSLVGCGTSLASASGDRGDAEAEEDSVWLEMQWKFIGCTDWFVLHGNRSGFGHFGADAGSDSLCLLGQHRREGEGRINGTRALVMNVKSQQLNVFQRVFSWVGIHWRRM